MQITERTPSVTFRGALFLGATAYFTASAVYNLANKEYFSSMRDLAQLPLISGVYYTSLLPNPIPRFQMPPPNTVNTQRSLIGRGSTYKSPTVCFGAQRNA